MVALAPCELDPFCAEIAQLGFAFAPLVYSNSEIESILDELGRLTVHKTARRDRTYAARNLLQTVPSVARLANEVRIREIVSSVIGDGFPVRGILFDKLPAANWQVGWHQDQIIPVADRKEAPGFTAWSVKGGVHHVRPPATVLERMLTLRIHLDDCGCENGALRVIPGSHAHGLLDDEGIQQW
jgi:hypothetical protein